MVSLRQLQLARNSISPATTTSQDSTTKSTSATSNSWWEEQRYRYLASSLTETFRHCFSVLHAGTASNSNNSAPNSLIVTLLNRQSSDFVLPPGCQLPYSQSSDSEEVRSIIPVPAPNRFDRIQELTDLKSSVDPAAVLSELGSILWTDMENTVRAIESFSPWNEAKVASCIRLMALNSFPSSLLEAPDSTGDYELKRALIDLFVISSSSELEDLSAGLKKENRSVASEWNIDLFVDCVSASNRNLNWHSIAQMMDFDGFVLPNISALERVTRAYSRGSGESMFPASALTSRTWSFVPGQIAFLATALASTRPLVSFDLLVPRVISTSQVEGTDHRIEAAKGAQTSYTVVSTLPTGWESSQESRKLASSNRLHELNWSAIPLIDMVLALAETAEGTMGSAQKLFEIPLRFCPEILVISLAASKAHDSTLRKNLLAALVPSYVGSQPGSLGVIRALWNLDLVVVVDSMVDLWSADPGNLPRLLDLMHELKALPDVLSRARPFEFSLDLAVLASRREYLNLEKWVTSSIAEHGDVFVKACIIYLSKKTESTPDSGMLFSLEATAVIFKCLHASIGMMSYDLVEKLKQLYASCIRANPRLASENLSSTMGMGGRSDSATQRDTKGFSGQMESEESSPSKGMDGPSSDSIAKSGAMGTSQDNSESAATGLAPQVFSRDVDAEANFHFQQIYSEVLTIGEAVNLLKRLKSSAQRRDQDVFACMIHNLFDEYRFFPKYPERELRTTGMLFGVLVQHQLVSSITLGIALRYVLEALRKSPPGKMTKFGLCALEQFKERLSGWPQYCSHILQIEHFKALAPELYVYVQNCLSSSVTSGGAFSSSVGALDSSVQDASNILQSDGTSMFGDARMGLISVMDEPVIVRPSTSDRDPFLSTFPRPASPKNHSPATEASARSTRRYGASTVGAPPPVGEPGGSVSVESLMTSAVRPGSVVPSEAEQDKVHFIFNNLSRSNLEVKEKELLEFIKPEHVDWLASYTVVKRASIEPNFHGLYLAFVEGLELKIPKLIAAILSKSFENVKVLLSGDKIRQSSTERTLLKNLGAWVGALTLARNKPILAKDVDLKQLVLKAYSSGLLIAVIPFVAKILESCEKSKVFRLPNPWLAAILGVLRELYIIPDLKLNLKFEIEVLCKNIDVDLKEVKTSDVLRDYPVPPKRDNPDFNLKKSALGSPGVSPLKSPPPSGSEPAYNTGISGGLGANQPIQLGSASPPRSFYNQQQQLLRQQQMLSSQGLSSSGPALATSQGPAGSAASQGGMMFNMGAISAALEQQQAQQQQQQQIQAQQQQVLAQLRRASPSPPALTASGVSMNSRALPNLFSGTASAPGGVAMSASQAMHMAATATPANAAAASAAAAMAAASAEGVTVIPNLAQHISLNPNLVLFQSAPALKRLLPVAVDRAVREIIQPVVERSCTISCITTQVLVLKDFANETDFTKVRKAAHQMVQRLAGSHALVTCKDLLRVSMGNHLRSLLAPSSVDQSLLEQTVQAVCADNLEMGCAIIERAATERAIRDIDEAITPGFSMLRHQQGLQPVADSSGLSNLKALGVYDEFSLSARSTTLAPAGGFSGNSVVRTAPGVSGLAAPGSNSQSGYIGAESSFGNENQSADQAIGPHADARASPPPMSLGGKNLDVGIDAEMGSLTLNDVVERFGYLYPDLVSAIETHGKNVSLSELPADNEVHRLRHQISYLSKYSTSPDEAAFMIAQKIFTRMYDGKSKLYSQVHVAILEKLRESCKKLPRELVTWLSFVEEHKKLDREVTVALLSSGNVLNMAEYDLMISKSIDYGRNEAVLDFAAFLISQCVVELRLLAAAELSSTLDVLTKIASRDESRTLPSAPNGLKALVEQARMKLSETGNPGSDNSIGMKELRSVSSDPRGTHESVAYMLEQWTFMYEMSRSAHSVPDNVVSVYVSQGHIMMSSEEGRERFIRVALEIIGQAFQLMSSNPEMNAFESIRSVVPVSTTSGLDYRMNLPDVIQGSGGLAGIVDSSSAYAVVDAFSKLISAVLRIESNQTLAEEILYGVLSVVVQSVNRASRISSKGKVSAVDYRLHFRLLSDLLRDLAPRMDEKSEVGLNTNNIQVLGLFANVLYFLQPKQVPGFAFAWVELLAHRHFLPRILTTRHEHGWSVFHKLLISLLSFLAPHLRASTLPDSVRTLYKGALRVLLVLLHDFPEFLCDFHFSLCDEIPTNCIQLRNLVLSAFPRSMRLPDPFLPDLKVDTLPEMSTTPRVLSKYTGSLTFNNIKGVVDSYLKSRTPASISAELIPRLMFTETGTSASSNGGRYNIPAMNALVFYVGQLAISQTQNGSGSPITLTSHMELFRNLASDLDPEGRYYFVNAVANQLRFPNNHTHYFSVLLLYLFADAKKEIVQEQIIRVLMERLIANRPHPWGLLITFIELIKNPRYNFWSHGFVRCVPEIQRLFETVARSCKMDSI